MRTNYLFIVGLLFLLVAPSIIQAQKITQEKGLTTAVFNVSQGSVKIYLPDDIRQGDVISGTVTATPDGKNEKQQQRNLAELVKYSIRLNGEKFTVEIVAKTFRFTVAAGKPFQGAVELLIANGTNPVQQISIPAKPINEQRPAPAQCTIPGHVLTGSPMTVPGPFDGNAANSQCSIGNQSATILAESPRSCIVAFPATANGMQTTQIKEEGQQPCTKDVSGVQMDVSAGKLNLVKGEQTYIDVSITGLQNLEGPALLILNNLTTEVVVMQPSNSIAIPLVPDSVGSGTFNRRFDVQSIRSGSFVVNVNLDLPEGSETISSITTETKPPTTTTKKCDCACVAKIEKGVTRSNQTVYKGNVTGGCSGFCGTGTISFPVCPPGIVKYQWTIKGDRSAAMIMGPADKQGITVLEKNKDADYSLELIATTECDCNVSCKSGDVLRHPGITGVPPGKNSDPPDTLTKRPPGKELFPPGKIDSLPPIIKDPVNVPVVQCGCICAISPVTISKKDLVFTTSKVTATCTPDPDCPKNAARPKCEVTSLTYHWSVTRGADAIEITGNANRPSVTIKKKNNRNSGFVLTVTVTLICSDKSKCETTNSYSEGTPNTCDIQPVENGDPKMDGGLEAFYIPKPFKRDDFVALSAIGKDIDLLTWVCQPSDKCEDTKSEKTIVLNGRVRFEWSIASGEGSFVKIGCLPADAKTAEGDKVIFQPPYLALPGKDQEITAITTIILSIIDDNPTQVLDATVKKTITITTRRTEKKPDEYFIEVDKGEYKLPVAPQLNNTIGKCKAEGPKWELTKDLTTPTINLPSVTDGDKMVIGQWIVLSTPDQRDPDKLTINCVSESGCDNSEWEKTYDDEVSWNWYIAGNDGKFILGKTGRYVIYEAPLEITNGKDYIDVEIQVSVKNTGGKATDEEPKSAKYKIRVYQAGIRISYPPKDWLPKDDNNTRVTSTLLYKDGTWKPGFAHMCRIQFFELINVSEEKGVAMNTLVQLTADSACRDLKLAQGEGQEVFNDEVDAKKNTCTLKELYKEARTMRPEREYSLVVHSMDYGSYGYIRSFGNIDKGVKQKPFYISVPVKSSDLLSNAEKSKAKAYEDNRATIPYDVDENRISDGGWIVNGNIRIGDNLPNKSDEDNLPEGDKASGDGLTVYEEYRGFKIINGSQLEHTRTNPYVKDIFIANEAGLNINLYASVSKLDVHEINGEQYVNDKKKEVKARVINSNSNPATHIVDQKCLRLVDGKDHVSRLGESIPTKELVAKWGIQTPAPPNWIDSIVIYTERISRLCTEVNIDYQAKLTKTVTHELLHGNNVWHHGEGDPDNPNSHNKIHGLRSGNMKCIMRYDNSGDPIRNYVPEEIPSQLCTSPEGTGYNIKIVRNSKVEDHYGHAAKDRGNCAAQIHITGDPNKKFDKR